jgi:hypothetical protein
MITPPLSIWASPTLTFQVPVVPVSIAAPFTYVGGRCRNWAYYTPGVVVSQLTPTINPLPDAFIKGRLKDTGGGVGLRPYDYPLIMNLALVCKLNMQIEADRQV